MTGMAQLDSQQHLHCIALRRILQFGTTAVKRLCSNCNTCCALTQLLSNAQSAAATRAILLGRLLSSALSAVTARGWY